MRIDRKKIGDALGRERGRNRHGVCVCVRDLGTQRGELNREREEQQAKPISLSPEYNQ